MEDFFHSTWFNKTKFFATSVGQWPYQGRKTRIFLICAYHILVFSSLPPLGRAFYILWIEGKIEAIVQCVPPFLTVVGVTVKYDHYTMNHCKTKLLFNRLREDWTMLTELDATSRAVLEKYANIGKATVSFYAIYIYVSLVIFLSLPILVPALLDYYNPLNESRMARDLYPSDYGVYLIKERWLGLAHEMLIASITINMFVACESMYMPLVCHSCGLLAVVGNRLKRSMDPDVIENVRHTETVLQSYDGNAAYIKNFIEDSVLSTCIKLHNRALWYADYIEAYYSLNLLILVCCNMVLISVTGVQIILKMNEMEECLRAAVYMGAQLVHLLFLSIPGELLLNTSISVREEAYDMPWYNLPPHSQKSLVFVIMKSSKPCMMLAGSFFTLKMETFSSVRDVVQSSMSYLMVLASFLNSDAV